MRIVWLARLAWLLSACLTLPAAAVIATPPAAAAPAAMPAWGASGLLQAASGLAIVVALIFLCAWVARRLGLQKYNSGRLVKVIASTSIGQRERVVVVEIGGTWLALGVTPGRIQSLHSMPAQEITEDPTLPIGPGAFAQKLRESLGRK
ncbi:flagellar biosynthetic protein FliO [Collimonas sp.]|uniref:flagellar biosynthetic protein FliO n=1 Tax=Collimonas sp. TaxID=1963772 RepID=UPI002D0631D0|nr:flagellar biosynthetic protein FliO [Collimonas sp.]HWW08189.1 flagellar biosynthetic protein FliO [Collimonas sp.]